MLTKKDFELFANEFSNTLDNNEDSFVAYAAVVDAIETFCDAAKQINPRFDRDKFRKACGLFD